MVIAIPGTTTNLDLQAPILVVPENCTDPMANVLVLDLGHLKFEYNDPQASTTIGKQIKRWFKEHPKVANHEPLLDHAKLHISSLAFWMGEAHDCKRYMQKHENNSDDMITMTGSTIDHDDDDKDERNAVIQPISLQMELGVEASSADSVPRVCAYAVMPSIVLALTPDQLARILRVYQSWTKAALGSSNSIRIPPPSEDAISVSSGSRLLDKLAKQQQQPQSPQDTETPGDYKYQQFHVDVRLQRLSIQVGLGDDKQQGMETHLVSVGTTLTTMNDGNSMVNCTMGWFWVLDQFQHDFDQEQRLLVHSQLPVSASELATRKDAPYNIMSDLQKLGVFDPSYEGSSDLADVSLLHSPNVLIGKLDPFLQDSSFQSNDDDDDISANTFINAKFTSLFVNWNPRAMKRILDALTQFSVTMGETMERKSTVLLLGPEDTLKPAPIEILGEELVDLENPPRDSILVVRAQLESVELCLRSARDDLPLFTLTMSSANASYSTKSSDGTKVLRASLGNLSVTTPFMGETHAKYHTILGLSPGKSDSLLSICYIEGKAGLELVDDDSLKDQKDDLAAWALITISPMRMVYIQAQVLALVEYATAGILGAMTSQAASQAAVAAADLATSGSGKKLFVVRATGFEVLLPEAAYNEKHFSVQTGELSAEYTALPNQQGGLAKVSISSVMIGDLEGQEMLDEPVRMGLDVAIPPEGVGSLEDQAFRIQIDMSSAAFSLLKQQYRQLLSTLEKNIGDMDLRLRDDSELVVSDYEELAPRRPKVGDLTHAGISFVENPRCMFINITIHSLSLDLLGDTINDGIVRVKATKSIIALTTNPHDQTMSAQISLRDLMCTDERVKSLGRTERSLISQDDSGGEAEEEQNFFVVSYGTSGPNKDTKIGLRVGSPRLVMIPDAISEVLQFVSNEKGTIQKKPSSIDPEKDTTLGAEDRVIDDGEEIEVETQPGPGERRSMSFSLVTGPCSLVLVDLGGSSLVGQVGTKSTVKVKASSGVTETIVCKGAFDAKATMDSLVSSGGLIGFEAQIHGDSVEIYTAFGHNASALQVMDPVNCSVYGYARGMNSMSRTVDLRIAILTPIDMCFSMRNYALMNAILDSISSSFEQSEQDSGAAVQSLSAQDARRIENLDHTLDEHHKDMSTATSFSSDSITLSSDDDLSTLVDPLEQPEIKSSFKMTLPDAKLTIVNDLQGLDDALIRFEVQNLVANAQIRQGERIKSDSAPYTGFDANLNCSLVADYFDHAEVMWKDFLVKPWEMTFRGSRGPNRKMPSSRPSTSLEIESFPCHVSFSEEFLMSLASANRMWSIYSMATSSLLNSSVEPKDHSPDPRHRATGGMAQTMVKGVAPKADGLRRNMAATAARTLVTALPYGLENNTGIDFEFKILGSGDNNLKACSNGTIEYFRFPRPKSKGTGGKRLYGQDVTFEKTVSIKVLESWIEIVNVDQEHGADRRHHIVNGSMVLFTQILMEGKTTVRYYYG
jgi:hypothetical protein